MRAFILPSGWSYRGHLPHHRGRNMGAFTPPPGQGCGGVYTIQHAAYLLTIFHCFSLRKLRPSCLVPSPFDCPVQELLHLPLRENVRVPQQLVFILIDCLEGAPGSKSAHSLPTSIHQAGLHSTSKRQLLICVSSSCDLGPSLPHPSRSGHQAQGGWGNNKGWEAVGGTSQPGNPRQPPAGGSN